MSAAITEDKMALSARARKYIAEITDGKMGDIKNLDGQRGSAPSDVDAFAAMAARFSVMVHALRDVLDEIDVNPVIVSENGCFAVDALLSSGNKIEQ